MDDLRALRRRHGDRRDDRRRTARPHLAWLPRPLFRPQRSCRETGARRGKKGGIAGHQIRHPAGACRPKGLQPAAMGRRRAAWRGRGSVAGRLGVGHPLCRWLADAARADRGRDRGDHREIREGRAARRARRLRLHRAAFRAWLPAAAIPLAALEPPHRPMGRLAGKPDAACDRGRAPRPAGGAQADARARGSRSPTGSMAASRSRKGSRLRGR